MTAASWRRTGDDDWPAVRFGVRGHDRALGLGPVLRERPIPKRRANFPSAFDVRQLLRLESSLNLRPALRVLEMAVLRRFSPAND